jgi:hypothetical protein
MSIVGSNGPVCHVFFSFPPNHAPDSFDETSGGFADAHGPHSESVDEFLINDHPRLNDRTKACQLLLDRQGTLRPDWRILGDS